jgi:hypothetical protein
MASKHEYERKLGECIDSMVEEMNSTYCADLAEEDRIESRMSDIVFREALINQIKEEILCKKLSESVMAGQKREVVYQMPVSITNKGISFSLCRKE